MGGKAEKIPRTVSLPRYLTTLSASWATAQGGSTECYGSKKDNSIVARDIKALHLIGVRPAMPTTHTAPSPLRSLSRYGLAIALVAIALILSLVLRVPFGNPFWFFFPVAVIASTWFGGRGPGWLAVGLSTLAVLYYFIPPLRSFGVKPSDVPFFLTFVACEVVANWLIAWQRETEDSLRRARDELEARVGERTTELKNANDDDVTSKS